MDRGKIVGVLLCLLAVSATVVEVWGLVLQLYWAIAVPVAVVVIVVMALLFWVGWTFIATDTEPPPSPGGSGTPSNPPS